MKLKKRLLKGMIFTNNSLKVVEEDYISRWNANAKQHFDDGDYGWIKKISSIKKSYINAWRY